MLNRLHVSDILNNFTRTKSVSMISCFNLAISTRSIKCQDLATVPALSSMLSTSFFFALMARLSSVGLIPEIPVLNVSINLLEVIVFVKRSDTCQSNEENRPSIHRPLRHNHRGCPSVRGDKSIAKRLLSTCLVLGETKRAKILSRSANQTCPITAEAVSSH